MDVPATARGRRGPEPWPYRTGDAYNKADVLPVFSRAGFETVFLDQMSLPAQIDALNSADVVAGPTGAAWTNLIWCRRAIKGLCWLPEQSTQFSAFFTIALIVEVELTWD